MLHVLKSESFHWDKEGEGVGGLGPLFLNFLDPSLVLNPIRRGEGVNDG